MAQGIDNTPWQYRLRPEDWANLQPEAGIAKVANALSSGQQAFNQEKMNQLGIQQKQMALAPKPVMSVNPKGYPGQAVQQIGELPANAETVQAPQVTGQYFTMGKDGQLIPTGVPTGTDKNAVEKMGGTGASSAELNDEDAKDIADQIKSGMLDMATIQKYYSGRGGVGAKNSKLINKYLLGDENKQFPLNEYAMALKVEQKNQDMKINVGNARKDILAVQDAMKEFKTGKWKSFNQFKQFIASQTSNPKYAAYYTAIMGLKDTLSLALGPTGSAPTNSRLDIASDMVDKNQSWEAMNSALKEANVFIDNRMKTMDEYGLAGFKKKYLGEKGSAEKETKGDMKSKYANLELH